MTHLDEPNNGRLLHLAISLMKNSDPGNVRSVALSALESAFGGCVWALIQLDPQTGFRTTTVSEIGTDNLQNLIDVAFGGEAPTLMMPNLPTGHANLGEPVWVTMEHARGRLILAAWPTPSGEAPTQPELETAADLVQTALDAAIEVRTLRQRSMHDTLTGILNRAAILERWRVEKDGATRHDRPLSVLFIDVNNFKAVNDRYGHAIGDEVLRVIAAELAGQLRGTDCVGRYAGDEFIIILPHTDIEDAWVAASRIEAAVGDKRLSVNGKELRTGVTVGAASFRESDDPLDLADRRMLARKQSSKPGRERPALRLVSA